MDFDILLRFFAKLLTLGNISLLYSLLLATIASSARDSIIADCAIAFSKELARWECSLHCFPADAREIASFLIAVMAAFSFRAIIRSVDTFTYIVGKMPTE